MNKGQGTRPNKQIEEFHEFQSSHLQQYVAPSVVLLDARVEGQSSAVFARLLLAPLLEEAIHGAIALELLELQRQLLLADLAFHGN